MIRIGYDVSYKNGGYRHILHLSIQFPLINPLDWVIENCRKALTYGKAIQLNYPHWNGEEWVEEIDLDDIPF